jgi:hypothetical protein
MCVCCLQCYSVDGHYYTALQHASWLAMFAAAMQYVRGQRYAAVVVAAVAMLQCGRRMK